MLEAGDGEDQDQRFVQLRLPDRDPQLLLRRCYHLGERALIFGIAGSGATLFLNFLYPATSTSKDRFHSDQSKSTSVRKLGSLEDRGCQGRREQVGVRQQ